MLSSKLLILGSSKNYAMEHSFVKAFESINIPCKIAPTADMYWSSYNQSTFSKIAFRTGITNIYSEIEKYVKQEVEKYKPTAVLVFKGMELTTTCVNWLNKRGIITFNFNPDDPFHFGSFASGNSNVKKCRELFTHHFCYKKENIQLFKEKSISASWLPFAYDHISYNAECISEKNELLIPCFIGNPDSKRLSVLNAMAPYLNEIHVYGIGWKNVELAKNIKYVGTVLAADYHYTLSRYRVQINIFREHNKNSQNMRTFEIMGNYGIGCSPASIEMNDLNYPDSKWEYANTKELTEKVNSILNLSYSDAKKHRLENRAYCLKSHTYTCRAETIEAKWQTITKN
jgi:hypothetical protein